MPPTPALAAQSEGSVMNLYFAPNACSLADAWPALARWLDRVAARSQVAAAIAAERPKREAV